MYLRNDRIGLLDSVLDLECFCPLMSAAGEEVSQLKAFVKQPGSFPHKQLSCISVCNLVEMKAGERRTYQMWQYSTSASESSRETSYLKNKPVLTEAETGSLIKLCKEHVSR